MEILRGPNIKPFPTTEPMADVIAAKTLLKVGDNITTDHIMPAGAKILPYRSNIPYLSNFCFGVCDKEFPERCRKEGKGIVVGGSNYGQGSSREHAALVPLYLGIKAVIAKSFARIHCANLANAGILPLVFLDETVYDRIDQMDERKSTMPARLLPTAALLPSKITPKALRSKWRLFCLSVSGTLYWPAAC